MSLEAVEFIENRLCEDNRIITEPLYQFHTRRPYMQSHLDEMLAEKQKCTEQEENEISAV